MNIPPNELLRRLAGGVHPAPSAQGVDGVRDRPTLDFRAMLDRATAGTLGTGLPVRVPGGLTPPVEKDQLQGLSQGADRAQREGIERALVELGGRTFRVDVRERSVIDAPDAQLSAVGGIDGYVRVGSEADSAGQQGRIGPARVVRNVSLLEALARVRPGED